MHFALPQLAPRPAGRLPSALPPEPCVAIIGGGMAGLCCALELASLGIRSVVFDTGEHGVGGRLATRSAADGSLHSPPPPTPSASPSAAAPLAFDHAAQYFTASDPEFVDMVQQWERYGAVRRWMGAVGTLHSGEFTPAAEGNARFVGVGGMRALAEHLIAAAERTGYVECRRPEWVAAARADGGRWRLTAKGKDRGSFDAVVLSHNGKCLNRLCSSMGVPAVHAQVRRLKLNAVWVLMAAFAAPLPVPAGLEGAFISGSEVLAWAGNNSAKLGLLGGATAQQAQRAQQAQGPECWTLISTAAYGKANKVPQENVPAHVAAAVTADLLAAFEAALGLPAGALPPQVVYAKAQLWGAALPLNQPAGGVHLGCGGASGRGGDWVHSWGSVQAAALSGLALARRIAAMRGQHPRDAEKLSQGLTERFSPVGGADIGQFPH